jgi:hypothetical protein
MANLPNSNSNLYVKGLLNIQGNGYISGSRILTMLDTSSFVVTASGANNNLTASYALTAAFAENVNTAFTSSYLTTQSFNTWTGSAFNPLSASFVQLSASYLSTSSFNAITSSMTVATASYVAFSNVDLSKTGSGNLYLSGSLNISGSSIFGSTSANTSQFTGSVSISGSIIAGNVPYTKNTIVATGHGFSAGQVVYRINAGTGWTASLAASSSTAEVSGIVEKVVDVNSFVLVTEGETVLPSHGFTSGDWLFVSTGSPGGLTNVSPINPGNVSKPVAWVKDSNTLVLNIMRGLEVFVTSSNYVVTASGANDNSTASYAISSAYATTASYSLNTVLPNYGFTSSYVITASGANDHLTASYAMTSAYALNAVTASHVDLNYTSSGDLYINGNETVTGTLTAQTLIVQYISSSILYNSGSTQFGSSSANLHQFTGSVNVTGSLFLNGSSVITSALTSSLTVLSASFASSSISASYSLSSSNALNAVSASYALTASYASSASNALNAVSASYSLSSSFASTASYVLNAVSASYAPGAFTSTSNVAVGVGTASLDTLSSSNRHLSWFVGIEDNPGLNNLRTSHITLVSNGVSNTQFFENSTVDIGSTDAVILSSSISAGNILLQAVVSSGSWNITSKRISI